MRHSISIGGGVAWLSADGAIFKQPNRCARAIPRRERPRCASTLSLRYQRAQGKPGARCTRSLVCSVLVAHECSHHRFTGTPSFPCAMVLTACFVLSPGDRAFLPPSFAENPANLTPASGRQDHTTSPYASAPFVRALFARLTLPRPSHPAPSA